MWVSKWWQLPNTCYISEKMWSIRLMLLTISVHTQAPYMNTGIYQCTHRYPTCIQAHTHLHTQAHVGWILTLVSKSSIRSQVLCAVQVLLYWVFFITLPRKKYSKPPRSAHCILQCFCFHLDSWMYAFSSSKLLLWSITSSGKPSSPNLNGDGVPWPSPCQGLTNLETPVHFLNCL